MVTDSLIVTTFYVVKAEKHVLIRFWFSGYGESGGSGPVPGDLSPGQGILAGDSGPRLPWYNALGATGSRPHG